MGAHVCVFSCPLMAAAAEPCSSECIKVPLKHPLTHTIIWAPALMPCDTRPRSERADPDDVLSQ